MQNNVTALVRSPYDIRDYRIVAGTSQYPSSFSVYNDEFEVPVKDQGSKPTCCAHALASTVEYHNYRQNGNYVKFSTEFIYGLREFGYYVGDGMRIRDGLNTLVKYGNVPEADFKGNNDYKKAMERVSANENSLKEIAYPNRISSYFKIRTIGELKSALVNHGVVVVGMKVYDYDGLIDDIYVQTAVGSSGGHCVFIYGWDERGWLVQNSWGKPYGGDGRFVIPFTFKFEEIWGVVDNITSDADIVKPKTNKFLNIVYKVINKIVNFFRKK